MRFKFAKLKPVLMRAELFELEFNIYGTGSRASFRLI